MHAQVRTDGYSHDGLRDRVGAPVVAERRVETQNGSVIRGEVVSVSPGRHLIDSPSLRRLEISEWEIRLINAGGGSKQVGNYAPRLGAIRLPVLANRECLEMVIAYIRP